MTTVAIAIDPYAFWRASLKGHTAGVDLLPTGTGVDDKPQPGLWKVRPGKDEPFVPLIISMVDENDEVVHDWDRCARLTATLDGRDVEPTRYHLFAQAVTKADIVYFNANRRWPGDAPPIGDNSKNYGVGIEGLKAELDDYSQTCRDFLSAIGKAGGVKTKVEADQASNMADAIGNVRGGIARKIEDARKALLAPLAAAEKRINAEYKPLVEEGQLIAGELRRASALWAQAETDRLQKIADEAAAKARAEAAAKAKADREAREAEQTRLAALQPAPVDAGPLFEAPAPILPPEPEPAPEIVAEKVKIQVGGQRGARRSLKTKRVAKVVDHAAALAAFADAPEVHDVVAKLAQKAIDAGLPTPAGVEVTEVMKL